MTARRLIALSAALLLVPVLSVTGAATASGSAPAPGAELFSPLARFAPSAAGDVRVRPAAYRAYRVDLSGLRAALGAGGQVRIAVPDPAGTPTSFTVREDPVMEPELQAVHPDIRTYAGADAQGSSIRLDVTPMGFHAFVRRPDGVTWLVDPAYNRLGEDRVLAYAGGSTSYGHTFVERELEHAVDSVRPAAIGGGRATPGGIVSQRTYRLAFVTDPSYAAGFADVEAEKVTLINRVNEVYNDDVAARFVLIGADDDLNLETAAEATGADGPCGANPCFTAQQLSACSGGTLDRNNFVAGMIAGADSFDIGHIGLGVDGGGIAGIGVVGTSDKAAGCTGLADPTGDLYAIDYVAHEMGHQMGANHTFNSVDCAGFRNGGTSVEPGSGSSVMAYAGICGDDNLQPHSDPYFSQRSVDEITATASAAPGANGERQTVALRSLANGEQFTLSCAGCPTSATVTAGSGSYAADLATAVQAATGKAGVVAGYDGAASPGLDGFRVSWSAGLGDVKALTVQVVTGTFSSITGTIVNGGPDTNRGAAATHGDHSPVVTAPADRTIPARTPFSLTGSATDADGDVLTYLWEQNDPGSSAAALRSNAKTTGPLFRQFGTAAIVSPTGTLEYHSPGENLAGTSPTRSFPDLAQVLAGNTNAATGSCPAVAPAGQTTTDCFSEFLPTAAWVGAAGDRALSFRLTARDRFGQGGGLSTADVRLTVDPDAGPFRVTSRSRGGAAAGMEKVTWRVAGTDTAALAKKVRIRLSTDGGLTYPRVLAGPTPNDGSKSVRLPDLTTSTARIRVEAVGNYFFDVNDANFSIAPAPRLRLGKGSGTFTSPRGSSRTTPDAKGVARFSFKAGSHGKPFGRAAFGFHAGHVSFKGSKVTDARVRGRTLTMKVRGKVAGRAGYRLVIVAVDHGHRDRIRVRLLRGKRVVYDSMPGAKATARPRTRVHGRIRLT